MRPANCESEEKGPKKERNEMKVSDKKGEEKGRKIEKVKKTKNKNKKELTNCFKEQE